MDFVYRHVAGMDIFLDHANAKAAEGIRLVFAGETIHDSPVPNPDIEGAVMLYGSPTDRAATSRRDQANGLAKERPSPSS